MSAARALVVAMVAAAQLAIVAVGPLVDRAPNAGEHRTHISSGSEAGCHPFHEDHCVVCRALSLDILDAPAPPFVDAPDTSDPGEAPSPAGAASRQEFEAPRARSPPRA